MPAKGEWGIRQSMFVGSIPSIDMLLLHHSIKLETTVCFCPGWLWDLAFRWVAVYVDLFVNILTSPSKNVHYGKWSWVHKVVLLSSHEQKISNNFCTQIVQRSEMKQWQIFYVKYVLRCKHYYYTRLHCFTFAPQSVVLLNEVITQQHTRCNL